MTAARERLEAWKVVQFATMDYVGLSSGAHPTAEQVEAVLPLIEEQARQAAFDVVRLERFAFLREQNPNKRAALLADRARLWTANHPEAWEALL